MKLNWWSSSALAQKVSTVEIAAEFFKRRAGEHALNEIVAILDRVPDREPERGDKMPTP